MVVSLRMTPPRRNPAKETMILQSPVRTQGQSQAKTAKIGAASRPRVLVMVLLDQLACQCLTVPRLRHQNQCLMERLPTTAPNLEKLSLIQRHRIIVARPRAANLIIVPSEANQLRQCFPSPGRAPSQTLILCHIHCPCIQPHRQNPHHPVRSLLSRPRPKNTALKHTSC